MIIELVSESEETIGRFQSPAVPRRGETVSYAGEQYVVEDVSWLVETSHDQNIERIRIEVQSTGE